MPSQFLNSAKPREIISELTRLAFHYHNALSEAQIASRSADFCESLQGLSLAQIREGCRRYRDNPANKFFPSPGQLREACKSPFADPKPRRYELLQDLPTGPTRDRVEQMLALSRKTITAGRPKPLAALKEEILERPPLVMTPEMIELEKSLAQERQESLARLMQAKGLI